MAALQSAWRAWHNGASRWMLGVSAGYALLMIFFGVLSFRDSRRVDDSTSFTEQANRRRDPSERKKRFTTLGGIPLKTVYTEADLAG